MYSKEDMEELYIPWHGRHQRSDKISKGVQYLGYWTGFGDVFAKYKLFSWDRMKIPKSERGKEFLKSQTFQEEALDGALAKMENCVVLSTTPTYYSQFQSACLLKSRGFTLLEGKCYDHPGYTAAKLQPKEHPGIPDRKVHWEHIWWKVIGQPEEIGLPSELDRLKLNNCGVDSLFGLESIAARNLGDRRNYLAVAWLPRGVPFPKGWKRFFSGSDYKLGVNFDLISEKSDVQECKHNFDLTVFNGWEPDFEKWNPS